MVNVTDSAKRELKRIIDRRGLGSGRCLRLATPPAWSGGGDFGIVVDDEGHGDHAVAFEGTKVLLVDSDLAERLAKAVFDFKESPEGSRFTLDVF